MNLNDLGLRMEKAIEDCGLPHEESLHGLIVAEEAGEVCRAILKSEQGIRGTKQSWKEELQKELAGVILAVTGTAAHYGIDLEAEVEKGIVAFEGYTHEGWLVHRPPNGESK